MDLYMVHGILLDIHLRDLVTGPLIPSTADTYQQAGWLVIALIAKKDAWIMVAAKRIYKLMKNSNLNICCIPQIFESPLVMSVSL